MSRARFAAARSTSARIAAERRAWLARAGAALLDSGPVLRDAGRVAVGAGLGLSAAQPRPARADTVYLEPDRFLADAFGGAVPAPAALWLTPEIQKRIVAVLEHPYRQARVRYWRSGDTSAWILDEIGKEFPITAGFVVRAGRLAQARVLIYRESRGGEVQGRGFVRQFEGAGLAADGRLDRRVDGITGATLSVDAMQRMAAVALLLSSLVPA